MPHSGAGQIIAAAQGLDKKTAAMIAAIGREHAAVLLEALKAPGGLHPDVYTAVTKRLAELKPKAPNKAAPAKPVKKGKKKK